MRQMKKKIIIAIIVTLLLTASIAAVVTHFLVKDKNEQIAELEERVVDTKCLAFAKDLPVNSIITQSDLTEVEIKQTSVSSGTYKIIDGNIKDVMHYQVFVDDEGATKVSNIKIEKESLVGRVVKTNITKNTLVMDSLLFAEDEDPTKDERIQEFNFLQIPSDLNTNDYIDVRIQFPTGEDYSVLIGKKVEKIAGENTIFIKMDEEEIMAMGSAIIEAYMQKGVRLYANKYSEPSVQLLKETKADYVAKYEYAVNRLMEEKTELELRKALVNLLPEDKMITVVSGDLMDEEGTLAEADSTVIVLTEMIEEEEYVTKDMLPLIPLRLKEEAKKNVKTISASDFTVEEIANYAGINKDYVEEIEIALEKSNQDVLNYYRIMNVITRDEIVRTYPVKEEVLAVVRNNPNLLETIKEEFNTTALLNTRVDEYKKLQAEYDAEYDEYKKEQIKQKMEALVDERVENVEKSIEEEITAQKAERVAYLESLING